MEQEQILEVRNADQPPVENAGIPTENPALVAEEAPAPSVGMEPIAEPSEQVASPKDDQTRFEYWQSQADKAKGELNALRQEVDYYRTQGQNADPSNGQPQAYPDQGLQEPSLKEPTAPDRPVNYNEIDAYSDPDSASFKYRLAKEEYRDNYMGYLQEKDQMREAEMQQAYETEMAQQRDGMMRQQAYSHATSTYGWDQNKSSQFVQWASNPDNLTLDNLAKLFELRSNPNQQVQQRTQQMQNEAERLSVPKTAVVQSGKAEQPRTDEQLFSDALLGRIK
tara:strand:+ start:5368 stop:6207 length:840 start_codon:yes stop_codon:yes gene_type:complete